MSTFIEDRRESDRLADAMRSSSSPRPLPQYGATASRPASWGLRFDPAGHPALRGARQKG